jgi:predicted Zn-ribbon and HTH transcriptional regulator
MSLDYSDPASTRIYVGEAVNLESLSAQLLRDPAQISDSAGRFCGKIAPLNCPSCGAPVKTVTGITVQSLCPNCHAQIDTSGSTAVVLAAAAAVEAVHFTLELGSRATLEGESYTVLGAMRRSEGDGSSTWSEYLLYATGKEFIWLVETDAGWQRAQVLNRWPDWDGAANANFQNRNFAQRSSY